MAKRPLTVLLAVFLFATTGGCFILLEQEAERPVRPIRHVILITVDTLRQDALSVYGSDTPTPNIDAFARDGMVFRRAYAVAPWTLPSLASLMTGLSPKAHQVVNLDSRLPEGVITLAEHMGDAGYRTAALGVNDLLTPASNFGQGFQHYDIRERSTSQLTQDSIQWLRENRDQDFLLWVHYFDPHAEYRPPPPFLPTGEAPARIGTAFNQIPAVRRGELKLTEKEKDWVRKLYEGEVRLVDHSLGKLLGALQELDLYNDSLVVVTSDHGEEFWEHGAVGHGHTLYEEQLLVPLIVKLPSSARAAEVAAPVALPSLLPAILEACAVRYEPGDLSYGSLARFWEPDSGGREPEPIFSERAVGPYVNYELQGVRAWGHKYIWKSASGERGEELYDLSADPGEKNALAKSAPEIAQQLRALLDADADRADQLRARLRLETPSPREIPEELRQQLKALGYVE